jgi:hypothetical protein
MMVLNERSSGVYSGVLEIREEKRLCGGDVETLSRDVGSQAGLLVERGQCSC